eukprot:RCo051988
MKPRLLSVLLALWCLLCTGVRVGALPAVVRVGFVYFSAANDMAWTWRHNQGVVQMHTMLAAMLPDLRVVTEYKENVPDPGPCDPIFATWASQGFDLVVGTSSGYQDCMISAAAQYPNTTFLHISGWKTATPNFGVGYARLYQPQYLAGYTAALVSQTGVLGVLGPVPIPQAIREISAWVLGAMAARPNVTVHVAWTGSWNDPPLEDFVTTQLCSLGVDVVNVRTATVQGHIAANRLGIMSTGYSSDFRMVAGESVLVSATYTWGALYIPVAMTVVNHTFAKYMGPAGLRNWLPGWDAGAVALTDLSFMVPPAVAVEVANETKRVMHGGAYGDTVFCRRIVDTTGRLVTGGACLDDPAVLNMTWLPSAALDHGQWNLPGRTCGAGTYGVFDLSTFIVNCLPCPPGTVSVNTDTASECVGCPQGTFSAGNTSQCTPCRSGTYGAVANATQCVPCPPGTIAASAGAWECVA